MIYPTLTLLEEQDFLEPAVAGNGRKSYQITELGKQELQKHQAAIEVILPAWLALGVTIAMRAIWPKGSPK